MTCHYGVGSEPALAGADVDGIRDERWHHVAWQFRFRDQVHVLFVDGMPVRRIQPYRKILNDTDEHVGVPFTVGGFLCWSESAVGREGELRRGDVRPADLRRHALPGRGPAHHRRWAPDSRPVTSTPKSPCAPATGSAPRRFRSPSRAFRIA